MARATVKADITEEGCVTIQVPHFFDCLERASTKITIEFKFEIIKTFYPTQCLLNDNIVSFRII